MSKIYKQTTHNSETKYLCFDGYSDAEVNDILTNLGHTAITTITKATYDSNADSI